MLPVGHNESYRFNIGAIPAQFNSPRISFERLVWRNRDALADCPVVAGREHPSRVFAIFPVNPPITRRRVAWQTHSGPGHSHSIVAGGFPEMSYTTREIPGTSLMIRCVTWSRNSYGRRAQRAVMKSMVSTARNAITGS